MTITYVVIARRDRRHHWQHPVVARRAFSAGTRRRTRTCHGSSVVARLARRVGLHLRCAHAGGDRRRNSGCGNRERLTHTPDHRSGQQLHVPGPSHRGNRHDRWTPLLLRHPRSPQRARVATPERLEPQLPCHRTCRRRPPVSNRIASGATRKGVAVTNIRPAPDIYRGGRSCSSRRAAASKVCSGKGRGALVTSRNSCSDSGTGYWRHAYRQVSTSPGSSSPIPSSSCRSRSWKTAGRATRP